MIIMILFSVEIVLCSLTYRRYFLRVILDLKFLLLFLKYYFFIDLIGTISLFLDISLIKD